MCVLASAVGIVILTHQEAVISECWSPPFFVYPLHIVCLLQVVLSMLYLGVWRVVGEDEGILLVGEGRVQFFLLLCLGRGGHQFHVFCGQMIAIA